MQSPTALLTLLHHEPKTTALPTQLQHEPKRVPDLCVARVNIKCKNEAGRTAVLAVSKAVHYDFGEINNICNVTLPVEDMNALDENPDIEWVDRGGAVFLMQHR